MSVLRRPDGMVSSNHEFSRSQEHSRAKSACTIEIRLKTLSHSTNARKYIYLKMFKSPKHY